MDREIERDKGRNFGYGIQYSTKSDMTSFNITLRLQQYSVYSKHKNTKIIFLIL